MTTTPADDLCRCGYPHSSHDETSDACPYPDKATKGVFVRSAFFNELYLNESLYTSRPK